MSKCVSFYNSTTDRGSFEGCTGLTTISFSLDTTLDSVITARQAFKGCTGLSYFDALSDMSFAGLTDAGSMFEGCSNMTYISLASATFESLDECSRMLKGCSSVVVVDLSSANFHNVVDQGSYEMFYNCLSMTNLIVPASSDIGYFADSELDLSKTALNYNYYINSNLYEWLGSQGGNLYVSSSISSMNLNYINNKYTRKNWKAYKKS